VFNFKYLVFFISIRGSLLVRDLGDVLNEKICNKKDFVNTENMATVVAVIPQDDIDKFENNYERISDNVVPSSAK
jgi:V-type H+-transporting ATPase subunit C